jgi:hypothetical protein
LFKSLAMKSSLFLILFWCFSIHSVSQEIVQIRYSKPFAILKFLETTKGGHGISHTFQKQIDSSKVLQDPVFKALAKTYASIELDYSWSKQSYPEKRKHTTSTWDLLCIASISSATNEEFLSRIVGVLPNDDYLKLKDVMTKALPFYDAFMYTKNEAAINAELAQLNTLSPKINDLFDKFKRFYGSSWDRSMPFHLTIYPIYGRSGQTTATPHANCLEMGFLLEDKRVNDMAAIGVHEMCHVLFEEQPLVLQQTIDSIFTKQKDPYASLAYRYIDEALATALGNGYGYNYLSGNVDPGEWYSDSYINLYAKALYPLSKKYLEEQKQVDKDFILNAISIFKETFPNALYDLDAAMMRSDAYFEDDDAKVIDDMNAVLHTTFRIYMSNTSIPIADNGSLENVKTSEQTQVFIIHKNQAKNLAFLKPQFKQLKKLPKEKNMLISFIDEANRPVIIVVAENQAKAIEGIKLLKTRGKIDPKQLWVSF